jgi:hypothetical protein
MASNLTPEQQAVLSRILKVARQKGASPKQVKAAVETGLVESNLKNLPGGDADSAGWRQERASIYKNPTNLDASISRFFDETAAVKGKYGRAGDLAAAVQRPAAQYRGRYQQRSGDAAALLGQSAAGGRSSPARGASRTTTTPGVDNSAARAALVQQFLGSKSADPVDFAMGIRGAQDVPGKTTTTYGQQQGVGGSAGKGTTASGFAEQRIGHYAETSGKNRGPELDTLQKRFGMTGEAWCAMFATTAAAHGGASRAVRTPSVAQINQWASEGSHGYQQGLLRPSQAQAGDLITFGNQHVGVVDSVDQAAGTVTTIEGNTSNGKVQKVTRSINEGRIARPSYHR